MANSIFIKSLKPSTVYSLKHLFKLNCFSPVLAVQSTRSLYDKSTLGIDGFEQQREKTKVQMGNILNKFKEKMEEYTQPESKNMIFTEDLKNMIHLSENDKDLQLVIDMIKKFNQQNKQLRFGNYVFGPVVMRLFYVMNKPDMAFKMFKLEEVKGFFDQMMTYQILLDLLYENQKYKEILEAMDIIKQKNIEGAKFPKNVVVLTLAACYKMNSKESFDYAAKLWGELKEVGHLPMRRATTFYAGLALNQGYPEAAMEIVSVARNQNYTTIRNLKVAALTDLGRVDDAVPILKSIINEDVPELERVHTFNKDVIEKVKEAILKSENADLTLEFNRLEQVLRKQGHISEMTLDEQLCSEIKKPPVMNNRQRPNQRFQRFDGNVKNQSFTYRQRPGLSQLV